MNGWWLSEARRIGGEIRGFSPKAGTRVSSCRSFWSEKNTRFPPSTAIESLKPLVWPESGSGFASNHWLGPNRGRVLLQTIGLARIGVGFCFKPLVWPESGSVLLQTTWFGSNRGRVLLQTTWFDPNRRSVLLQTTWFGSNRGPVLLQTTWFDPNRRSVLLQTTWFGSNRGSVLLQTTRFGSNRGRALLQKQYRFWVLYVRKAKTLLPPEGEQGLEVRLATGVAAEASSLRAHFFIPFERLHGQEDAEAEYEWKNEHLHRVESHNEFAAIVQDIEERHDGG